MGDTSNKKPDSIFLGTEASEKLRRFEKDVHKYIWSSNSPITRERRIRIIETLSKVFEGQV